MQPRLTTVHSDHAKYIPQYLKYSIPIYSTPSVAEKYKDVNALEPMRKYKIGSFTVLPLKVPHGDCECYSYIVEHKDFGRLLFCTDAQEFPYIIKGVKHLFIEVNYSDDVIMDNVLDGSDIRSQCFTHMSLDTAIKVATSLYNPELMTVCAIHLSDTNTDENVIKKRFRNELGIDVNIAIDNITIPLLYSEF